jgi:hypothetical protein
MFKNTNRQLKMLEKKAKRREKLEGCLVAFKPGSLHSSCSNSRFIF